MSSLNNYKTQAVTAALIYIVLLQQKSFQINQIKKVKMTFLTKIKEKLGNLFWLKIYKNKIQVLSIKDG